MSRRMLRFACLTMISLLVFGGCRSLDLSPDSMMGIPTEVKEEPKIESTFSRSHLLMSSASKFERAGQIEEAIKLYEKVVKDGTNKPEVYEANRHLAILYDLSDQASKAREAFKLALQNGNPDVELLNDYGYFLLKSNDYPEAIKILDRARTQAPENERVATNLGMALVSSGRADAGYQLFALVVGNAEAASNVGAVLLQQGKTQEAQKWLQTAVDSNHDDKNLTAKNMLELAKQK